MSDDAATVGSNFITATTISVKLSMNDETGQLVAIRAHGDDNKNYHFDSEIPDGDSNTLVRDFLSELSKVWPGVGIRFKANQLTISEIQITKPASNAPGSQSLPVAHTSILVGTSSVSPPVIPPPDKP